MDCIKTITVKGQGGTGECVLLSPLDTLTNHLAMRGLYVFQGSPDLDRLERSLASALTAMPEFGASMIKRGHDCLLRLDDCGVRFGVYRSVESWSEGSAYLPVTEHSPLIDPQVLPQEVFTGLEPLSAFRLTLFADGYWTLAVRSIHSQADGLAYASFLQCWSGIYSGRSAPRAHRYSRRVISALAQGPGHSPSPKFRVLPPPNFDLTLQLENQKPQQGYAQVDIHLDSLQALLRRCSAQAGVSLSLSDLIHALAWKAFATCSPRSSAAFCTVYSIVNLRGVAELDIPEDYLGNAVIERHASLHFGDLRTWRLDEVAQHFRTQTKPISAADIEADIAFLCREQRCGYINDEGRFSHFVRGSVVDCLDGTGLYVNDMRFLNTSSIAFESPPVWFETVIALGFRFVGVYRAESERVILRYVGERSTLLPFTSTVTQLIDGDELGDDQRATLVTNPWL